MLRGKALGRDRSRETNLAGGLESATSPLPEPSHKILSSTVNSIVLKLSEAKTVLSRRPTC
ncbi:hypothetical protein GGE68_003227 [Rhizobium leguminosarum]|nr:hypothetical protein [Rhizobium leguminosarum]